MLFTICQPISPSTARHNKLPHNNRAGKNFLDFEDVGTPPLSGSVPCLGAVPLCRVTPAYRAML
jgi:hypothetical protein